MPKKTHKTNPARNAYRVICGKLYKNGTLKQARFYTDSIDPNEHELKKKAIKAKWEVLVANGKEAWSESDITELQDEKLITKWKQSSTLRRDRAIVLVKDGQIEPLQETQIAPLCDPDGNIRTDAAVPLVDCIARNIVTHRDFRINLFKQLWTQAVDDPKALFEWCNRNLGWTSNQTQAFLNINIPGAGVSAIAFDASEVDATDKENEDDMEDESEDK